MSATISTVDAVNSRSAVFSSRVNEWQLMRDFMAGASALKTKERIPALSPDWKDDMWKPYVERAYLFNATEISVDGFAGMVTVKPPTVSVPDEMLDFIQDVTGEGHDVAGLVSDMADEAMTVGCLGLLVDYPQGQGDLTIQQARTAGLRPMVSVYPAESILEVDNERRGGDMVLTRVRLAETFTEPYGRWGKRTRNRVRVLELVEGIYTQTVYTQSTEGGGLEGEAIAPLANGAPMTEIPFQLVTSNGNAFEPPRPPLHTLAEANLAHLQDSALHQHGLAFCAQPVRVFAGWTADGMSTAMVGSSIAAFSNDVNAKSYIVEASPEIVGAIVAAMTSKKADMAVLGARFLAADSSAQIAENTSRLNRSGDTASLSKITSATEYAVRKALRWAAGFMGANPDTIQFQMSRDYMPVRMAPQELQALVGAWQGGAITQSDLYANLVQGEIVAPREGGADDYREELEAEGSVLEAVE